MKAVLLCLFQLSLISFGYGINWDCINPCESTNQVCKNGGRCEMTFCEEYRCACADGFIGKNCQCRADQFVCKNDISCIPINGRCDGDKTCEDGSDELNCPEGTGGPVCSAGWPIRDRAYIDSGSETTTVSPDAKFSCDGVLTQWRLQAKASHPLRAIVFRREPSSPRRFNIVGYNDIPASQIEINKPITYTVPENERIAVKAGDVIGWSVGQAVLNWNPDSRTKIHRIYAEVFEFDNFVIVHRDSPEGRAYSIQATVEPSGGNANDERFVLALMELLRDLKE